MKRKNVLRNNKGQVDFPALSFGLIVIVLIILFFLFMRLFNEFFPPISNTLGNLTYGKQAQESFNRTSGVLTNSWDYMFVGIFVFIMIALVISAFLINTHPIFTFIFLLLGFVSVIFISTLSYVVDNFIVTLGIPLSQMPFTRFVAGNITWLIMGVMVFIGVIIYGKIRSGISA